MNVEQTIFGIKYDFQVIADIAPNQTCSFTIKAVDKATSKSSHLNTLNQILAWFDVDENDTERIAENTWYGTAIKVSQWQAEIISILNDSTALYYLEQQLDRDRAAGEWGN